MEGHIPAPQLVSVTVTVTASGLAVVPVRMFVWLQVGDLTSLAGNARDERGNAEEGEGAHVDDVVEKDGLMWCGCGDGNGRINGRGWVRSEWITRGERGRSGYVLDPRAKSCCGLGVRKV